MQEDGTLAKLASLPNHFTPDKDTAGWMGDWNPGDASYTYLAGMLFTPGTPISEGFTGREILPGEMAVGWLQDTEGDEGGELHAAASGLVGQARDAHGYTYDGSRGLFEMEVYPLARFFRALERGERVMIDFYTPCRKVG